MPHHPAATTPPGADPDAGHSAPSAHTTRVRLAIGLTQGLLLYALYQSTKLRSWPATQADVFAPLLLLSVFIPLLTISAWGRLPRAAMLRWLSIATLMVAALGWYDLWRMHPEGFGGYKWGKPPLFPSFLAWVFFAAGLFMAHVLALSAAHDGRRIARYTTYFDQAWKLFIQHLFSAGFLAALWLVLFLGGNLFKLIGLRFLLDTLEKSWFAIPVSAFAIAWGLHLTDVKPDIVHGIRNLMLTLLSWVLPVIAVLSAGFLLSLPFTGLAPLWGTRMATSVLLGTAAALVVLINTAFQNGARQEAISGVVRFCARLGCLCLLPIVGIAVYALSLRVGQYGWTSDRVIAAACLLVALCYAVGYTWAAVRRQGWLQPIAHVNIGVTWVILAVLVALFSPVADPARISVQNQVARLRDGKIDAKAFDYTFLRFQAGRHGQEALQRLALGQQAGPQAQEVKKTAQAMLLQKERWEARLVKPSLDAQTMRRNIVAVWPAGAQLPDSFWQTRWESGDRRQAWSLPDCLTEVESQCEAFVLSLDDDAEPEILLLQKDGTRAPRAVVFDQDARQQWRTLTTLPGFVGNCESLRQSLRDGDVSGEAPRHRDLRIGDRRITIRAMDDWDAPEGAAKTADQECGG